MTQSCERIKSRSWNRKFLNCSLSCQSILQSRPRQRLELSAQCASQRREMFDRGGKLEVLREQFLSTGVDESVGLLYGHFGNTGNLTNV